jgi:PEP-CTERM motif
MRLLLPSILTLALCLATSTVADADTVTYMVSIVGSGSIGNQTFADERVTLTAYASTEELAASGEPAGDLALLGLALPSLATVQGIGTFGSQANFIYNEGGGDLEIADSEDRLGILSGLSVTNTPASLGPVFGNGAVIDGCDPYFGFPACPGYISTDIGELIINSFDPNSATGQEIFNPVPEPGSFLLIGSGLLAMSGVCRKRLNRQ